MKRKLFLLMVFLTPCLSWAKAPSAKAKKIRTPASMSQLCDNKKTSLDTNGGNIYKLDTKAQLNSVNSDLADVMRKQGVCDNSAKF